MTKINIELKNFSQSFEVRRLVAEDVEEIYTLCAGNAFYYEHCPPTVRKESILEDMVALPPKKTKEDKYYLGFFENEQLIAIMDFINAYPVDDYGFIGLFMIRDEKQGKGLGTFILDECFIYLSELGFKALRLAWVESKDKAKRFWLKQGFKETGEKKMGSLYTAIVAEKLLK